MSEDIIKAAKQAGLPLGLRFVGGEPVECMTFELQHFAQLVAAAEREACAKVCDTEWDGDSDTYVYAEAANECAAAIRARGQQ